MELMFIGTGSGVTSLKRNHSSILVKQDNYNLLIDCGDGTAKALKQNNISFNSIDSIIFSHYHADHFSGIATLVTQMHIQKRQKKLSLYTHKNLVAPLENILKYTYLFKETFTFELEIIPFEHGSAINMHNELSVLPKQNSHISNKREITSYDSSYFISSSFFLSEKNRQIVYTADLGTKRDLFLFEESQPEVFITETSHIGLDWILEMDAKIKPDKIILTHISDEDEYKVQKWHKSLPQNFAERILVAEDGHIVTLNS